MNTDPVCGRVVSLERTVYESSYEGNVYYFCSAACKEQFDKRPEVYARRHAA